MHADRLMPVRWHRVTAMAFVLALLPAGPWLQQSAANAAALGVAPVASTDNPNSLTEMLQRAPDILAGPKAVDWIATYANVAAQLAAIGAPVPRSSEDDAVQHWLAATILLARGQPIHDFGLQAGWREQFGFDILQVDQWLTVGQPPDRIFFFRGRFDETELRTAWEQTGYQNFLIGDTTVAFIRGDYANDLRAPGPYRLGGMNYAVILGDGTLVFTSTAAAVGAVLDVEAGRAPSLAERSEVQLLLSNTPADLVSAQVVLGAVFSSLELAPDSPPIVLQQFDQGPALPPFRLAIFGISPGGRLPTPLREPTPFPEAPNQPRSEFKISLLLVDQATATAVAPIVLNRLATFTNARGRAYAELFPERAVSVVADAPVVLIELQFAEERLPLLWWDMVSTNDLLFLVPA